jgi:hypothetical protein
MEAKYRPETLEKQRFLLTLQAHSCIFFFVFLVNSPRLVPLFFFRGSVSFSTGTGERFVPDFGDRL